MAIKHKRTSARAHNNDPGAIQPEDWNDTHSVEGLLGALLDMAATPGTMPYIKADGTGGAVLTTDVGRALLSLVALSDLLALLNAAPTDSPLFTGNARAPTPAPGTNSTAISTTAFVQSAIAALVNSSPATLDTLKELADAIGDDPNFAATMATLIGTKLAKASNLSDLANVATARTNLGLALVAASGTYADLSGKPTLGTAAALAAGTAVGNLVQVITGGKLPVLDGSNLTGVVSAGSAQKSANLSDLANVATALANLNGEPKTIAKSLATSGYIKFGNGLILQWGFSTNLGVPTGISFPVTFPTACAAVLCQLEGSTTANVIAGTVDLRSASGFQLYQTYTPGGTVGASGNSFTWSAIGY
ncbi:hypothetical protein FNL56_13470 [Tardiphaga sp. vice304]|uniref:gp53-like domain-containing protein n=1 Tax=Tardiphaga sp. vice304 TaxID=2592817 RepID=UPI001162F638|nr:hypothetical protein [Tardiphaga sp. vice304]QDM27010.1 hypothetical protein FNL56_13470 [Tardiphaga sp. vice304]